jgi:hypothetical protein
MRSMNDGGRGFPLILSRGVILYHLDTTILPGVTTGTMIVEFKTPILFYVVSLPQFGCVFIIFSYDYIYILST